MIDISLMQKGNVNGQRKVTFYVDSKYFHFISDPIVELLRHNAVPQATGGMMQKLY